MRLPTEGLGGGARFGSVGPFRFPGGSAADDGDGFDEPEDHAIGPLPDRRRAREWGLVLQSMGIRFELTLRPAGWVLIVPPAQRLRALEALEAYEEENENWPPPRQADKPRHAPSAILPLAFSALAAFFLMVTGPAASGSSWFRLGTSDAQALLSEPWRMVTALTLHADGKHMLGNLISGSIFGAAVSRRLGPGVALIAILLAGILGNAANAIYHYNVGHFSIGSSTAVFGAVGLLAAVQFLMDRDRPRARKRRVVEMLAPLIGGLALLGALGSGGGVQGGKTDLWAHLFGFLAGVLLGAGVGWLERRRKGRPVSAPRQLAFGAAGILIVVGAWQLARL